RSPYPELDVASADAGRRLEMVFAKLVCFSHVDDDYLFTRGETTCDLGRPLFGNDLPRFREHVFQGLHGPASLLPLFPVGSRVMGVQDLRGDRGPLLYS